MERKLSPVGFNAFALIGLLVLLPFSTALLTNLTTQPEGKPFEDIVGDGTNIISGGNPNGIHGGTIHSNWVNPGSNYSTEYKTLDPTITDEELECYELFSNNAVYSSNPEWNIDVTQCEGFGTMISPYLYSIGYTNYNFNGKNWLTMDKTHDYIPGNQYIGTSGNNFAFSVEQAIFDNTNKNKDLSGLQIRMVDNSVSYDCNVAPSYNITFDYEIKFVHKTNIFETTHYQTIEYNDWSTMTFDDYSYSGDNIIEVYNPVLDTQRCYIGLNINFNFDSLRSLDFADFVSRNGNNISNISAIVEIIDLKSPDFNNAQINNVPLPFAGNGDYLVNYGAKYTSAQQTNLFLKGGALILGVILFILAIASTPYYDPFMSFFKGRV